MRTLESPVNMEEKTICLLLLDVSGSMQGEPINLLNKAVQEFYEDIKDGKNEVDPSTKDKLEISVVKFDQETTVLQTPALIEEFTMPILESRGSTTCTCNALRVAIDLVSERKAYYDKWGIKSSRPWIILMTDGNPYPDTNTEIDTISQVIKEGVAQKKYEMLGIGIGNNVDMDTLKKMTGNAIALDGLKFGAFFKWLSRSMSIISQSKPGQTIDLSKGANDWMSSYKV